ncbi:MAG: MBL fold metallo-hydrolase [Cyanobacteria bacterium P01_A01_bin.123]
MDAKLHISKQVKRWGLLALAIFFTLGVSLFNEGYRQTGHLQTGKLALAQPLVETESPETPNNTAVYHFKVGDFNAMVVSDGTLSFPVSFFLPNADPDAVAAVLTEHFLSTEDVFAHVNTLYVETDEHKVLIDTGAGDTFGPSVGHVVDNLEKAGVPATDIDTVILTHAHPDHIGGILDDAGQLQFPNAQYYLSQAEWEFWTAPTVEMPNSLLDEETQANLVGVAQGRLAAIADRRTLFQIGDDVIPGISSMNAVGHTPGQVAFLITAGEDSLVATGDVFFSDPLNLENPDWEIIFDADPQQGVETRKQLLSEVTANRRLLLVPHMPFPGLGHVRPQGEAYGWEPIVWRFEP